MNDLTEDDLMSAIEKLSNRPLIGEVLTSMNSGLFEKAETAAEETKKAQIAEAIALAKAEILSGYYSDGITEDQITEQKVKTTIENYLGDSYNSVQVVKTEGKLEFTITVDGIVNKMNIEIMTNLGGTPIGGISIDTGEETNLQSTLETINQTKTDSEI